MFRNCATLEELKGNYYKLVMIHHPDKGGELAKMQEINNAYDEYFPLLKDRHANKDGEIYTKENEEVAAHYKDIIDSLMRFEGIMIEIIGSFIWVNGETRLIKDELKKMSFKWHSKKECWFLPPIGYKKSGKKQYDMEEIRGMYGVQGSFKGKGSLMVAAV